MAEESDQRPLPEIRVHKPWCKSCGICADLCPRNVLLMEGGYPVVMRLEACTACGICEVHCPDFAITVTKPKSHGGTNP